MAARDTKSAVKERLREAQVGYIRDVLARTGVTPTELARMGDMHPTTLTRFLNDPAHKGTLAPLTLSMIADRTGIAVPADATSKPIAPKNGHSVLREREAEPYVAAPDDPIAAAVEAFIAGRPGIDPWTLRSRSLEYEGYMPGDVLFVDLNAKAEPGDIVCAQLYDWQRGGAETVFRMFHPPVLIGAGPEEAARRPRLVDDTNVVVKGVVVMSFRRRAERVAA